MGSTWHSAFCYIIVTDDGVAFGHWIDIPVDFWGHCLTHVTQIAMAELIAPVIAIRSHLDLFREVAATFYIDNVVAQCALVRGASKAADLSLMGLAFMTRCHALGCSYWIEWVPSNSNLADDGSRRGSVEASARALNIHITEASFDSNGLVGVLR